MHATHRGRKVHIEVIDPSLEDQADGWANVPIEGSEVLAKIFFQTRYREPLPELKNTVLQSLKDFLSRQTASPIHSIALKTDFGAMTFVSFKPNFFLDIWNTQIRDKRSS